MSESTVEKTPVQESSPVATSHDGSAPTENAESANVARVTRERRPRLAPTKGLPNPTEYVKALEGEYSNVAFNEERAVLLKGKWRAEAFKVDNDHPMDLEIGTGNGFHYANYAVKHPLRAFLGIEIKFKPLIQTIRRALTAGARNCAIARYDAYLLQNLFEAGELNNVFIHFPDPWSKKRQWKHRLIQTEFLELLHSLMRPGSFLEFKTDNLDYFEWAAERFHASSFRVVAETRDLHTSPWARDNFITHFESLFLSQGLKINYARLERV